MLQASFSVGEAAKIRCLLSGVKVKSSPTLKVLLFEEKPLAKVGWLEQSVAETSDLPLQKYYYTIKEFDNDIRFILVAEEVGLLFVFRSVVHRCAITRNSLTLEDQVAYLGSRC